MSQIQSLHGMTPAEIFQSGIENIDQIESISMTVKWRDGRITTGWSETAIGDLALMLMLLNEKFRVEHLDASNEE